MLELIRYEEPDIISASILCALCSLHPGPQCIRTHRIGVVANMTNEMNVKHQPYPIESIIWMMTAASPAPSRQRQRLLPAVAVAGDIGSGVVSLLFRKALSNEKHIQ